LHFAAHSGHVNVVQYLLDRGAMINIHQRNGPTPLHVAAQEGHFEVVRQLIQRGATVDFLSKVR
jgi:ankyrin repeat protein